MKIEINIFIITIANLVAAEELANKLINANLAACVNIIPNITSIYKWNNKVEKESEAILLVKSRAELFELLKDFVKSNHQYETPEIISIPIKDAEENYYKWIISNTTNE